VPQAKNGKRKTEAFELSIFGKWFWIAEEAYTAKSEYSDSWRVIHLVYWSGRFRGNFFELNIGVADHYVM
jgi:hypothetical protein